MLSKSFCINNLVQASTFHFMNKQYRLKGEIIFHLVFTEMQIYGPRHESRILPWAKCPFSLETLFICNNINDNPNENFYL